MKKEGSWFLLYEIMMMKKESANAKIEIHKRPNKTLTRSRPEEGKETKIYIPSTLNTDYLLWHTQLIVCAVKY